MGMYTSLRGILLIKDEFRLFLEQLLDDDVVWADHAAFREFASHGRSGMIPFALRNGCPESWYEQSRYSDDFTEGVWTFFFSLNDWDATDSEIRCFIKTVVPVIASEVRYLESIYEASSISTLYELRDGVVVAKPGIAYNS